MTALVERHGLAQQPQRAGRFTAMVVVATPFMRETLARALRGLGAVEVVEAGSLAEARVRGRGSVARDLVVVDGTLPDGSGIALMGELRALGWTRGLVLSSAEDPYTVRAALAAGVRALVVSGRAPAAPAARPSGSEGLSAREIEVLQLVADGQSNKEIGTALGLSALTVKSHLARIARKLGTGDRAELVMIALRNGLIS